MLFGLCHIRSPEVRVAPAPPGSSLTGSPVCTATARFRPCGAGKHCGMRLGNMEVRPLGGGMGCLFMVLGSILLSVLCTVGANLVIR